MSQPAPMARVAADGLMPLMTERESTPLPVVALLLLGALGGLDTTRAFHIFAGRIADVPTLRQRRVNAPFGCGRPVWIDDPSFMIAHQVASLPSPAPGGEPAVLDAASELTGGLLPRDRPLWMGTLVTDAGPDRQRVGRTIPGSPGKSSSRLAQQVDGAEARV